jgi:hypothetical protein
MQKLTTYVIGKTTLSTDYDNVTDDDVYGSYGNEYLPGCIIRSDNTFFEDHIDDDDYEPNTILREYSFFYPPDNGEKPGTPDYRKYALQDYKRSSCQGETWGYLVVKCETQITTDTGMSDMVSDILCGVESDGDKDYFRDIVNDLKSDVKHQLSKFGFTDDEINQSVDNAVKKKGELSL